MTPEHIRIDDDVIDKGNPYNVIDPVWRTANIYEGAAEYNKSISGFTRAQRLLHAVIWYMSEVNNGGHYQFYENSTGIVWKDALAGFQELGLNAAAAILQESVQRIGGEPSLDRPSRREQMNVHHPAFDDLDDRFYELEKQTNLDAVMQGFILIHRDAFYFEGDVEKSDARRKS